MRKNILIGLGLFVVAGIVYIATSPLSISAGDSGEIATAAYTWGIAHPTGFPVYIILAKLFSYLLPWFEFAYRLNIFSSLAGAATIGIVFLITQKLTLPSPALNKGGSGGGWPGIASALSLAFGYTFWTHSGTMQVYSLTGFFFALAILIFLHWIENVGTGRDLSLLCLLAVISGLGAGTHLTFLLFSPFAIVFFILRALRGEMKNIPMKVYLLSFIFCLLSAIAVYSYIPLRARQSPDLNWGNPSTKTAFINYITQRDYSEKIGSRGYESWSLMLKETGRLFSREFTWLGFLIVLIGAGIAFKKNRQFFYAGLAVIFFNILLLGNYGNNEDIIVLWRYFLPSYVIMAMFLAFAFSVFPVKAKILSLLLPAIIFAFHFSELNRRDNILIPETTRIMFSQLPQGSIFVLGGDSLTGATMYAQTVLGQRKDILLISQPLFTHTWYQEKKKKEMEDRGIEYSDDLSAVIRLNSKYEAYSLSNDMGALNNNYKYFPQGIIYKMYPKNEKSNLSSLATEARDFWQKQNLDFLKPRRVDNETLSKEVVAFYTGGINNLAAYLTNNGDVPNGIEFFKKSLEVRENKNALYNLANIYMALGDEVKAMEHKKRFERALKN